MSHVIEEDVSSGQNLDVDDFCMTLGSHYSSSENDGTYMEEVIPHINAVLTSQSTKEKSLLIGTHFEDASNFREFIRSKAITENFGMKIKKSDRKRIVAVCSYNGCPWRVRASVCADGNTFEVRKLIDFHSCPGINRAGNKHATSSWVAQEIEDMVKKCPDIAPRQINSSLESKYGLSLPYMKLWRSRQLARDNLFGMVDDNYKWIPALKAELLNRNPGSHITYEYSVNDNSFQRFFVSFRVCIDGFLAGCRPLIGLDACHLKSKYLGVLLAANALDGNNGLFTIAFAVVESESKRSWQWFLKNLAESFDHEVEPLSFISDMEKGLLEAKRSVFPNAEHRVCMRHLWKNIKKYHHCKGGQKIRNTVWAAANAYATYEYDLKMLELYELSPQLHGYLTSLPYKWSKCKFSCEIKNQCNTNNMSESFNSWIIDARDKPVVDLVDTIRGMLMEQRAARKLKSHQWTSELVPSVEEYIRHISTEKIHFIIRQSTPFIAEIEGHFERHEVNIENKECSCMSWQLTGLPCIHAVNFIGIGENMTWHNYVAECYYTVRYKMAYDGAIATLPGRNQWKSPDESVQIGVPKTIRPRGRPRKRRFRSFIENGSEKSKTRHRCGRCGLWGHHQSTCKEPIPEESVMMLEVEPIYEEGVMMPEVDIESFPSELTYVNLGTRAKLQVRRDELRNSFT